MTPEGDRHAVAAQGGAGTADAGAASVVRAARAHPIMIGLIALAAVFAAALWLASRSPTYEATAEILVTPAPDDGGPDRSLPLLRTSGDRTRIVQTAASLVDSTEAESLTADAMGGDWTPERVGDAVAVEPVGQSDVLAVTARDGDPKTAALLANDFARSALEARARALEPRFTALIDHLEAELRATADKESSLAVDLAEQLSELRALRRTGDPTLSLSRSAELPASSAGRSATLILLLALLAGVVVGVATALVAELVGPARVADAAEASAVADSPVLARVPVFAADEGSPPEPAAAAFRTLQLQLDARVPPARVVLLASSSSSDEGADCVTAFGTTLAGHGANVLILDLDAGRDSVGARLEAAPAPVDGIGGLQLLSADARRATPDDLAADPAALLTRARERFDYVLVNAPPLAESGEALRVVHAVDAVVLIVRPRRTTTDAFRTAVGLLQRTRGGADGLLVVSGRRAHRRRAAPRPSGARAAAPGAEATTIVRSEAHRS